MTAKILTALALETPHLASATDSGDRDIIRTEISQAIYAYLLNAESPDFETVTQRLKQTVKNWPDLE